MAVEARTIADRDTWLWWRRQFITASVIGGLPAFNCHPYVTPLRIYAEKRGVEFDDGSDNKVLRRGRWFEGAVHDAVNELRPDWELIKPKVFLCNPETGIGATPDFYIKGDPRGHGVLQAKTVAFSVWRREWDEGKDIPLWVTLQCLTECMMAGADFGVVAVLLVDPFNAECSLLDVPRHAGAEAKIINEVKRFWGDIRNAVEPDADFARDGAVLKLLMPREQAGSVLDLTGNNELPDLFARRAAMLAEMKRMKNRCNIIETKLIDLMRDHATVTGIEGWGVSYKVEPRKEHVVRASTPRVLRIKDRRPMDQRPQIDDDEEHESED